MIDSRLFPASWSSRVQDCQSKSTYSRTVQTVYSKHGGHDSGHGRRRLQDKNRNSVHENHHSRHSILSSWNLRLCRLLVLHLLGGHLLPCSYIGWTSLAGINCHHNSSDAHCLYLTFRHVTLQGGAVRTEDISLTSKQH